MLDRRRLVCSVNLLGDFTHSFKIPINLIGYVNILLLNSDRISLLVRLAGLFARDDITRADLVGEERRIVRRGKRRLHRGLHGSLFLDDREIACTLARRSALIRSRRVNEIDTFRSVSCRAVPFRSMKEI